MLLQLLEVLREDPAQLPGLLGILLATVGVALLVAITVHEFSHALIATSLGDETARRLGRLSLNPLRHLDPVGTLLLFLAGFGWGRPVPVNPMLFRRGPKGRQGMALVAAAGPLSNLTLAFSLGLLVRTGLVAWHSPFLYLPFAQRTLEWVLADIVGFLILYNILLGVFNLIPLAPLDGSSVFLGLVPQPLARKVAQLQAYGPAVLMTVVGLDLVFRWGILWRVIGPVSDAIGVLVVGRGLR
jgi:Zn-dependent protease